MRAVDRRRGGAVAARHAEVVDPALHVVAEGVADGAGRGERPARGLARRQVGVQLVSSGAVGLRQVAVVVAPAAAGAAARRAGVAAVQARVRAEGHRCVIRPAGHRVAVGVAGRARGQLAPGLAVVQTRRRVRILLVGAGASAHDRRAVGAAERGVQLLDRDVVGARIGAEVAVQDQRVARARRGHDVPGGSRVVDVPAVVQAGALQVRAVRRPVHDRRAGGVRLGHLVNTALDERHVVDHVGRARAAIGAGPAVAHGRVVVGHAGGRAGQRRGSGHLERVLARLARRGRDVLDRQRVRAVVGVGRVAPAVHDNVVARARGQVERQALPAIATAVSPAQTGAGDVAAVRDNVQRGVERGRVRERDRVLAVRVRREHPRLIVVGAALPGEGALALVSRVGVLVGRVRARVAVAAERQRADRERVRAGVARGDVRHTHAAAVGGAVRAVKRRRRLAIAARHTQVIDTALGAVAIDIARCAGIREAAARGLTGREVGVQLVAAGAVGLRQVAVIVAPGPAHPATGRTRVRAVERRVGRGRDACVVAAAADGVAGGVGRVARRDLAPGLAVGQAVGRAAVLGVAAGASALNRVAVRRAGRGVDQLELERVRPLVTAVQTAQPAVQDEVVGRACGQAHGPGAASAEDVTAIAEAAVGDVRTVGDGVQDRRAAAGGLGPLVVPGGVGREHERLVALLVAAILGLGAGAHRRVVVGKAVGVAGEGERHRVDGEGEITGVTRDRAGADAATIDAAVGAVKRGGGVAVRARHAEVVKPALHAVSSLVADRARPEGGAGGRALGVVRVELVGAGAVGLRELAVVVTPAAAGVATRGPGVLAVHTRLGPEGDRRVVGAAGDRVARGVAEGAGGELRGGLAVIQAGLLVDVLLVRVGAGAHHGGAVGAAQRRIELLDRDLVRPDVRAEVPVHDERVVRPRCGQEVPGRAGAVEVAAVVEARAFEVCAVRRPVDQRGAARRDLGGAVHAAVGGAEEVGSVPGAGATVRGGPAVAHGRVVVGHGAGVATQGRGEDGDRDRLVAGLTRGGRHEFDGQRVRPVVGVRRVAPAVHDDVVGRARGELEVQALTAVTAAIRACEAGGGDLAAVAHQVQRRVEGGLVRQGDRVLPVGVRREGPGLVVVRAALAGERARAFTRGVGVDVGRVRARVACPGER